MTYFYVNFVPMKRSRNIFYLDDDTDDLDYFKEGAERLGHHVTLYSKGQELIQDLKVQKSLPDIIFLDVHMPILDGKEILILLKNTPAFKSIPVVMISGAYPKKLVKYLLDNGANHLMKKPTANMQFALQEALDEIFLSKSK